MKGSLCALLDASVLYPVSLRNLLMCLTLNGLFQARWSRQIHEEWIRAVLRDRPDLAVAAESRARLDRHSRRDGQVPGGVHPGDECLSQEARLVARLRIRAIEPREADS